MSQEVRRHNMDVGIVGIGHSKFGRRDDVTVQELAFEPFVQALDDAGMQREDIGIY